MLKSAQKTAYSAITVVILIVVQLALSFIPNVELVTAIFCAWCFVFGVWYGLIVATAFSLLRCFVFGFFPSVIVLYLVYYNFFAVIIALGGRYLNKKLKPLALTAIVTVCCCLCCVVFTLLDGAITPLFYGMKKEAALAYLLASLPFIGVHVVCTAVTVPLLFPPLKALYTKLKGRVL